jgi:hypothetical protein
MEPPLGPFVSDARRVVTYTSVLLKIDSSTFTRYTHTQMHTHTRVTGTPAPLTTHTTHFAAAQTTLTHVAEIRLGPRVRRRRCMPSTYIGARASTKKTASFAKRKRSAKILSFSAETTTKRLAFTHPCAEGVEAVCVSEYFG